MRELHRSFKVINVVDHCNVDLLLEIEDDGVVTYRHLHQTFRLRNDLGFLCVLLIITLLLVAHFEMQKGVLRDLRNVNLGLNLGHELDIVEGFQVDCCALNFTEDFRSFLRLCILSHLIEIAVLQQLFFSVHPD